jgi:hypothetical protein
MPVLRAEGREGYTKLEPGKPYFFKVIEAEAKYSQRSGDDQIQLVLFVGDKSGKTKVFETLTFSDKAYFRIEHFLKAAGRYPGDGIAVYFDETDVINLSGRCTIRYELNEKNNKEYAKIDDWLCADRQTPVQEWIERAQLNTQPEYAASNDQYSHYNSSDRQSINPDDIPF